MVLWSDHHCSNRLLNYDFEKKVVDDVARSLAANSPKWLTAGHGGTDSEGYLTRLRFGSTLTICSIEVVELRRWYEAVVAYALHLPQWLTIGILWIYFSMVWLPGIEQPKMDCLPGT